MDSDSEERLDTGIDSLDQIEDLLGTRAKGFVGDDKNCIINRWGDLDIAGQEAILQKVGKAVSSIESHIDTSDTTGDIWRKRAKYLDLVPDVYELQKEMRGSLRDGIQWLDPIPQAIFSRALIRLVKATFAAVSAVKWRKDVEGSAVFQQWDLLHPRAQASILDETYKAIIPVREERRVSTQNHKNGKFESLYPKLERYQELAGSLQSHAQGSSARNVHESTIDRRQVSNAMPPPPVPSYVAGYRRIALHRVPTMLNVVASFMTVQSVLSTTFRTITPTHDSQVNFANVQTSHSPPML